MRCVGVSTDLPFPTRRRKAGDPRKKLVPLWPCLHLPTSRLKLSFPQSCAAREVDYPQENPP